MKRENRNKKLIVLLMGLMILAGFILRFIYCFRGYPYQLHPDEPTIVENAINMLSRHSWEAYVYNRPDQFEIKCNAFLFTAASWIRYHMPAYEAFELNKGAFYLVARFYTTMFGTAMIPMMYLVVGKILKTDKISVKKVQLLAAALTAFSPVFIEHSAYATPDVVLCFFVLLIAYISSHYLETGAGRDIYLIAAVTGICISIKYPAAIMCAYIAFIVFYKVFKDGKGIKDKKSWKEIVIFGFSAILIILLVIFMIAPNLYTDFSNVVATFITEARPNHLGQDGRGFLGNMKFYIQAIAESFGLSSAVLFAAGSVFLIKNRRYQHFPLLISGIYWICLSKLALYWVRWGLPMFLAYIIITAIGGVWLYEQAASLKKWKKVYRIAVTACIAVLLTNTVVSGMKVSKWSILKDTRIEAMGFCEENHITKANSVYEGYTPLVTDFWGSQYESFELKDGVLKINEKNAAKKYYVLSDSFRGRYRREAEKYPEAMAIYDHLDTSYPLIYTITGEDYKSSPFELQSIRYGLEYLLGKKNLTGLPIYIYDLQPEYKTLQPYGREDVYVSALGTEAGSAAELSEIPYEWVAYDDGKATSFISRESNRALDVTDGVFASGTQMQIWDVTEGENQKWTIQKEDGYFYILSKDNLALTCEDNQIMLRPFTKADSQKWVFGKEK